MNERAIKIRVKQALTFAARDGLRRSLFTDPASDDADIIMAEVLADVPKSQKPTVVTAIEEWRELHGWLAFMEDKLPEVPDAVQASTP